MGLGSRIRKLREELGLTVTEVASKADLTPSMLSQVEREITSPSISSLRRLATALSVPAFYFLVEDMEAAGVVVRRESRRTLRFPGYKATYQLLSPNLQRRIELMHFELAPGEATCESPMSHEGEENLVVVSGQLKAVLPGSEVTLGEGDSIYFEGFIPHQLINTGESVASAICAISPPSF